MVTERSVVSVQPRSATMSEPDSGRCFRFGFRTQKLFVERGVGGCVILLVRQDQIFAAQRAQWRRAAGGGGVVVVCALRCLCMMALLQNGGRSRTWLRGWDGMVERHDRPKLSR